MIVINVILRNLRNSFGNAPIVLGSFDLLSPKHKGPGNGLVAPVTNHLFG